MALSGDYRSLGWNPGHLTFSPLLEDQWKSAAGGFEVGARISSSVLEREDVWERNMEPYRWGNGCMGHPKLE